MRSNSIYLLPSKSYQQFTEKYTHTIFATALSIAAESPASYGGGDDASSAAYRDIPGLCKAATLKEIEAQGWSLNPGRYVGVAVGEAVSDEDFKAQLETLNEELVLLNAQARELEATIASNVAQILET